MNKARLTVLSDFLHDLPDHKFSILQWRTGCGSVCCAGGWACTIPEFQEAGLHFTQDGQPMFIACPYPTLSTEKVPMTGYHALAYFFGLSHFTTTMVFGPDNYQLKLGQDHVTLDQVRERLFNLITSPCP